MRKTKKIMTLIMSMALVGSIFTGCGSEEKSETEKKNENVTISDLITATKTAFEADKSGAYELNMEAGLKLIQDEVEMNIDVAANLSGEADEDTVYTNGELTLKMTVPEGMAAEVSEDDLNQTMKTESYTQKTTDSKLVYEYNEYTDSWTVTENDTIESNEEITDTIIEKFLNSDFIKKLSLTNESGGYKVSGKISAKEIYDFIKESDIDSEALGIVDSASLVDSDIDTSELDSVNLDVSFVFGENKVLKSLEVSVSLAESMEAIDFLGASVLFDTIKVKVSINKIGGVSVEVPNEVINSAE